MKTGLSCILFILVCNASSGADFYSVCMSEKRPVGFDFFVEQLLNQARPVGFKKKEECSRLAEVALKLSVAVTDASMDSGAILPLFPNLTNIAFTNDKKFKTLLIGNHPKLKSLRITGAVALTNFGDASHCKNLEYLTIFGDFPGASVDLERIGQFPKLKQLTLGDISVKHAKAIETLPELKTLGMEGVTLDEPLEPSVLSRLEYRRIK